MVSFVRIPAVLLAAALVWYRRDLRTADHESLHNASRHCQIVIPFTTIDPEYLKSKPLESLAISLPTVGPYRKE